ncbi:hypothetical protein [Corallococcus sp. EGB]|uniref:hypothetical protein n=1 Tax=Corallococcus sp. EGB TaxID=1521117 RepID=UPI001CBA7BB0|nr:hypothetical protein [Corallococcus sp. EGB]
MITRWKSAVGRAAVGVATLSAMQAGAQQAKAPNTPVNLTPVAKSTASPAAPKATGSVDVAVDEGAKGTRLYRYDRASGKLTLLKQLTQKDATSATSGFKALSALEAGGGTAFTDPERGGAVSPEGPRPKGGGGPPGGHDPGALTQTELANINRELTAMKLNKTQVKIGPPVLR